MDWKRHRRYGDRCAWREGAWVPLALLLPVLAGCASAARTGRTSFEVLGAPAATLSVKPPGGNAATSEERIDFIPAYAKATLAAPVCPAAILSGGAGVQVVHVVVTVDERGLVSDVEPSWQRARGTGPLAEACLEAAKAAVRTWQLAPAHEVHYRRVPGREDEYLRTEAVAQQFEVRFVFEPTGRVR